MKEGRRGGERGERGGGKEGMKKEKWAKYPEESTAMGYL